MKKNLTKKLMLSVLTLAFAVVSLGASTFAWFTTSPSAKVEQYNAQVIGGAGIELAVGTINEQLAATKEAYQSGYYVNELPLTELKTVIEDRHGFTTLNHISALNSKDVTKFGYTNVGTEAEPKLQANLYDINKAQVKSAAGFIAFKLYVKADNAGTITLNNIKLTSTNVTWTSGVEHDNGIAADPVKANESKTYNLLDALRIAVVSGETTNVCERAAGATNTRDFSKKGAYEIYNEKNKNNTGADELLEELPTWTNKTFTEADGTFDGAISTTVVRDQVVEYEVYIWLEGYDAECVNALFASSFTLDISFAYTAPTGA